MIYAPDDLPVGCVECPDGSITEVHIKAAALQCWGGDDVRDWSRVMPDLLSGGGVDRIHDRCGTIHAEIHDAVRNRWRRPRVVSPEGIRWEGPKFLTGSNIQRMQLAVRAAGIGRIQLAFKYACGGKTAPADVGPPLHGEFSHVCGR